MATNMSKTSTTSSSAIPTGVVVWEWSNEFGNWTPYESHVVDFIEKSNQNNSQAISLGDADPKLKPYILMPQKMVQIRIHTGMARPVRRLVYPMTSMFGKGIAWLWAGDHGSWHVYDEKVAAILEHYYSLGLPHIDLSSTAVCLPYVIDLKQMTQTRMETSNVRKIKREVLKTCYPFDYTPVSNSPNNSVKRNSSVIAGFSNSAKKQKTVDQSSLTTLSNGFAPTVFSSMSTPNIPIQGFTNSTMPPFSNIPNAMSFPQTGSANPHAFSFQPGVNIGGITFPMAGSLPSGQSVPPYSAAPNYFSVTGTSGSNTSVLNHAGPLTRKRYASMIQTQTNPPSTLGSYSAVPGCSYNQSNAMPAMNSSLSSSIFSKNQSGRIAPVISGITNVLVSPTVPQASDQQTTSSNSKPRKISLPSHGRVPNSSGKGKQKVRSAESVLKKYIQVIDKPPADEDCCICCDKLNEASGYGTGDDSVVINLLKCSHHFHRLCFYAMYDSGNKDGSIQCPTCKTIYGEKMGNCPSGVLDYNTINQCLPGHPGYGTIVINYNISPGIQGSEHPNPGKRYTARGFPRVGYLPDNEDGRKVLQLLLIAWRRKLTFTIGSSSTTGESDTVIWNEIHHKTEFGSNFSGHGYPDENYINNVLSELACQGVTEEDL